MTWDDIILMETARLNEPLEVSRVEEALQMELYFRAEDPHPCRDKPVKDMTSKELTSWYNWHLEKVKVGKRLYKVL